MQRTTLAALLIKKPDMADEVLKRIEYDDDDLSKLAYHRPELAKPEFHDIFFKVIDMIKNPERQEWAVRWGIIKLLENKQHASVMHLINALGKRLFNGRKLKDVAIERAFSHGARKGQQRCEEIA